MRGHSASAGIAVLEPGQSPEALLAAAGSALETARAAGGGQAAVFAADRGRGGIGSTRSPARTAT